MKVQTRQKRQGLSQNVRTVLKWLFYALTIIFFYCRMTSGDGDGSKSLMLIPFATAIACYEREVPSAIIGAISGILIDMATGQLLGFTGLYLCLFCGIISGMFRQFLRKNIINYFALTLATCLVYLYIDYYFFYVIWDYEGYQEVLKHRLIPSHLKTIVFSPLCYLACLIAEKLATVKRKLELEEKSEMVDRV
ncbi:MAG: rod shape-determining protein MreD [Oscillospiraceae bacterium]|nr:rod shape-determining protein MreD [Oscillospiraceae bacterium]